MNNNADEYIHNILDLKLKAYDDFLSCTQLLGNFLENEDMGETNRLVKCREDLMRTIDEIDGRILDFRNTHKGHLNSSINRKVDKIFVDINLKIKQIIAANEDCSMIAANQCAALKNALENSRREEKGFRKYSSKPQLLPKFLDIQT